MNEVITQTLYFVGSYLGLIFFMFFGLNWLTRGYISSFLKVKAAKGAKLLVGIHSVTDTYWRAGQLIGDSLKYKTRAKVEKLIAKVDKDAIYSAMSVFCIEVDEAKDTVYKRDKSQGAAPDAEEVDNLLNRAIGSPQINDKKLIAALVLSGLALLVSFVILGFLFKISGRLDAIAAISGNL